MKTILHQCRIGWTGKTCRDCQVLPGCVHGTCTQPLECKCLPGYTGFLCERGEKPIKRNNETKLIWFVMFFKAICSSGCSRNNGYCTKPGTCRCRVGWMGENCTKVKIAWRENLTISKLSDKHKLFSSISVIHIQTARMATANVHGWVIKVTQKNVSLTKKKHTQECNCKKGWGGYLCDEELNYCELNPDTCQNGGKCTSLTKDEGSFSCECPAGFERGERCDRTNMTLTSISRIEIITPLPMTMTTFSQEPLLSERNATTAIAVSTTETTTTMVTTTIENEMNSSDDNET
jgi:hypothetical protein